MTEHVFCNHVYVAGSKKGQVCGTFCRKGGPKCGEHSKVPRKCEHGKQKSVCVECEGVGICEHGKRRCLCKDCSGGALCQHNRQKSVCIECKGVGICEHGRRRTGCKQCHGGAVCEHGAIRSRCRVCGGSQICPHDKYKWVCKECDPCGAIANNTRTRLRNVLKHDKSKSTIQYLGCDIEDFKLHIEGQFKPGMTWDNYGKEWHIDHIIPLKYPNPDGTPPTLEQVIERLDFTNCQPMWAHENVVKGNRWVG